MLREKKRKEYYCRAREILKTELNARNNIKVINTLAIMVLTFSFTTIN